MRILIALLRARGLRRLKHGFCPGCYSSPPRPECPLCEGEVEYGPFRTERADLIRQRWEAVCATVSY